MWIWPCTLTHPSHTRTPTHKHAGMAVIVTHFPFWYRYSNKLNRFKPRYDEFSLDRRSWRWMNGCFLTSGGWKKLNRIFNGILLKKYLSIDIAFDLCYASLDYPFQRTISTILVGLKVVCFERPACREVPVLILTFQMWCRFLAPEPSSLQLTFFICVVKDWKGNISGRTWIWICIKWSETLGLVT
jgi:hypothetical protein